MPPDSQPLPPPPANRPVGDVVPPHEPGPFKPPVPPPMASGNPLGPAKSNLGNDRRNLIRWGVIVVVVAVIVLIIVLVLAGGSKKPSTSNNNNPQQAQGPQAAQAVDVDQTNNSISGDISSLHEDTDFPADGLSDQNLGL